MSAGVASGSDLSSLTFLMVEDETIVAFLIEDMLRELGCGQPRHAASVSEALALLASERFDAAVLDINLAGEKVYPVAERLESLDVPFLFATGYGIAGLPAQYKSRPVLQKPFTQQALAAAVSQILAR